MRRHEVATASAPAAVAIAGNANAPVTTYHIGTLALGQSSVPLTTAAKDPRPVFAAVDVAAFTGREWLSAEVDQFIAGRPHGYVFIEAEAGLGKTAFAAWLVQTRGYLSHFSRYSGGSSVQAALANLSAQLFLRFSMDDQAPGGMLPEWAQNPSGFESLLAVAADQASGQGEPLVLVVDGLDEAETSAGSLPFGLPLLLPDGVYVVATYRTGRAPGRPDAPSITIRIAKDDKRNEQDIHVFLDKAAREDVVAAQLAEAGMDPAVFISLLGRRCGGVWIYLRYVLYELRSGLRRPDEIGDLPADLSDYYAAQISRWRRDPAWDLGLDRLLATLGVAREALSAESLARLTGNVDHPLLRRWCDLIVRPMLTATRANYSKTPTRYEIYHASFREFLNAGNDDLSTSGEPQPDESLALAEELQKATLGAHTRICDAYLAFFGGLQNGLPALAENLEAGGIDDGYPLRHLAHHLCCAGRVHDLHALLAVEHSDASGALVNTWFAAHDFAGSINNYLDDLGMARDESAAATDQDIARGKITSSLGMEIRYILMMASIASYTANISTGLLRQLVHTGMWSSRRGFDHSRRITDPRAQLDALLVIRGEVAAEEHPAILAQA